MSETYALLAIASAIICSGAMRDYCLVKLNRDYNDLGAMLVGVTAWIAIWIFGTLALT